MLANLNDVVNLTDALATLIAAIIQIWIMTKGGGDPPRPGR